MILINKQTIKGDIMNTESINDLGGDVIKNEGMDNRFHAANQADEQSSLFADMGISAETLNLTALEAEVARHMKKDAQVSYITDIENDNVDDFEKLLVKQTCIVASKYLQRGMAQYQAGETTEAMESLQKAVEYNPSYMPYCVQFSDADEVDEHTQQLNLDKLLVYYQEALQHNKIIQQDRPSRLRVLESLADIYQQQDKPEELHEVYGEILQQYHDSGDEAQETATQRKMLALYLAQKDDAAAEPLLKQLADSSYLAANEQAAISEDLAALYVRQERYAQASEVYIKLAQGSEENSACRAYSHERQGFLFKQMQNYKQARKQYLAALEIYEALTEKDEQYVEQHVQVLAEIADVTAQMNKSELVDMSEHYQKARVYAKQFDNESDAARYHALLNQISSSEQKYDEGVGVTQQTAVPSVLDLPQGVLDDLNENIKHIKSLSEADAEQREMFRQYLLSQYETFEREITYHREIFKEYVEKQYTDFSSDVAEQRESFKENLELQKKAFQDNVDTQQGSFEQATQKQAEVFDKTVEKQAEALNEVAAKQLNTFDETSARQLDVFNDAVSQHRQTFEDTIVRQDEIFDQNVDLQRKSFEESLKKQVDAAEANSGTKAVSDFDVKPVLKQIDKRFNEQERVIKQNINTLSSNKDNEPNIKNMIVFVVLFWLAIVAVVFVGINLGFF